MQIRELEIPGLKVIEPTVFKDHRGYFFESFQKERYTELGIDCQFVQDNEARSDKDVLRGLHFQTGDMAQAKLVRVVRGSVLDVAVDIRPGSPTHGKWESIVLSEHNKLQLFVPRGFAHGYLVLEDNTIFSYKCDNYYSKEHEAGIRFDDPMFKINWQVDVNDLIISQKDQSLPFYGENSSE